MNDGRRHVLDRAPLFRYGESPQMHSFRASLRRVAPVAPGTLAIRALAIWAFCALSLGFARVAHADGTAPMKVAVVDVQRAVMQTEDGLRAQAMLKKLFDSKQQELNKRQQDLGKQHDEIEKQQKVLSKEAYQKRVEDWQKQMVDLQQIFVEYNKELEKKQKELTDPVFEKVLGIIKRLAARDGYDVVLDKQTVAYIRSDLDLTDQCIQLYNTGAGGAAAPEKK
jgi:outer membrane protein